MKVDVAVIGAGILGCTMARQLARYRLDVAVVEAAHDVAEGATKANSGIIHTGFHPRGGSLKGTSCVQGNARYDQIVEELQVPFLRTGGMMVAFHPEGVDHLKDKRARARENGAGELEIISGNEARILEPRLSERVTAALLAPSTGIISPFELALATARNAAANGVQFQFGFDVERVERTNDEWTLHAKGGDVVRARYVVNMAGEEAALLDAQVHAADIKVRPRRGQYVVFDKQGTADERGELPIRHVLFQAQETNEGGTLLTPTVDGNLLAGPTSENVRTFHENATTAAGIEHVKRVARKLIPDIDFGRVITAFSGIRANIVNVEKEKKDFVVRVSAPRFVSALGIKNPGITSAPVLVDRATELLRGEGLRLEANPMFDPSAQGGHLKPFMQSSPDQQASLLQRDPRFGHVLCRCENVTEGDVRACMCEPLPPRTLDGMKRRLRCGMGRCQGSFCMPRVARVMADELGCDVSDVLKGERGGRLVRRAVK